MIDDLKRIVSFYRSGAMENLKRKAMGILPADMLA
jgi:hypothetical protein